jgi:glycosyltransferase involved in cell wall biosynthesis
VEPPARTPRRVALFTNHLRVGGAEAQLVQLAANLVARGDDVRLFSLLPTEAYADEMARLGVPIVELRGGVLRSVAYISESRRLLRKFAPDVVVSFLYQANVVARLAARLAGVPVVISSIRNENFGGRGREFVMRVTDRLATVTTTNSALARASLTRRRVARPQRLVVVPNGVDVAIYDMPADARAATRAEMRAALGVGTDALLWLAAGRLVAQKDVPNLLDAFAQHAVAHPESRLVIAGDGELRHELAARTRALGLAGVVTFLGIRSDIPRLLCAADAFVLSSAWEGLPNAVMEAMAAGVPVVTTRVGGAAELVDDPATGMLVPPRHSGALADAMNAMAKLAPQERVARGRAGLAKIARDWSAQTAGEKWLALIDECESR